jgi:hypothetical protein
MAADLLHMDLGAMAALNAELRHARDDAAGALDEARDKYWRAEEVRSLD